MRISLFFVAMMLTLGNSHNLFSSAPKEGRTTGVYCGCGKSYATDFDLAKHFVDGDCYNKQRKFPCLQCPHDKTKYKMFASEKALNKHQQQHESKKRKNSFEEEESEEEESACSEPNLDEGALLLLELHGGHTQDCFKASFGSLGSGLNCDGNADTLLPQSSQGLQQKNENKKRNSSSEDDGKIDFDIDFLFEKSQDGFVTSVGQNDNTKSTIPVSHGVLDLTKQQYESKEGENFAPESSKREGEASTLTGANSSLELDVAFLLGSGLSGSITQEREKNFSMSAAAQSFSINFSSNITMQNSALYLPDASHYPPNSSIPQSVYSFDLQGEARTLDKDIPAKSSTYPINCSHPMCKQKVGDEELHRLHKKGAHAIITRRNRYSKIVDTCFVCMKNVEMENREYHSLRLCTYPAVVAGKYRECTECKKAMGSSAVVKMHFRGNHGIGYYSGEAPQGDGHYCRHCNNGVLLENPAEHQCPAELGQNVQLQHSHLQLGKSVVAAAAIGACAARQAIQNSRVAMNHQLHRASPLGKTVVTASQGLPSLDTLFPPQ